MDPATGTFTTMDTYGGSLSDPMSLHKYLFANSNPVMYSDPSGHMTVGELMLSTTIMSALSATTNAIIAGLEYEKQQNYTPDIFDKGQLECIGLAFLKGLIIGAMSVLAIFVVYALALTVIQCMMAAGICALLAWMLGDDASFNRRNGNDGVAWIEETLSEGFIAAEVTFEMAGVSGGGETYDPEISSCVYESNNEIYYRTMSLDDYRYLQETGKVRATKETFTSPTMNYSLGYDGVTVRFEVAPGTTDKLYDIGVSNNCTQTIADYGLMPPVHSVNNESWIQHYAFFKGENAQTNIGLGQGTALDIFNSNIVKHSIVTR